MGYGDFDRICTQFPQPICNLFFRQLLVHPAAGTGSAPDPALGSSLDVKDAGLGVNPECTISRMSAAGGASGSVGNVANIVACGLSVIVCLVLVAHAVRRLAAVGRREFILLIYCYGFACVFQLLDTGSFFRQGTQVLTWLTACHVGVVTVLFWTLLWNSILGFQWVEDGTLLSLGPWLLVSILLFVGSTYIALDTAFHVTNYFASNPPASLYNAWLYTITIVWPLVAVVLYAAISVFVVLFILREVKPIFFFVAAGLVFALGEGARYALSHRICSGTSAKIDGSFVATLLETLALCALYAGWVSITESSWSDMNADPIDP